MQENNAYVYQHRRFDTNEVFYVGISTSKNFKRAFSKDSRSDWWKSIVKKTGYVVDIIYKNISWEQACKYEKNLISMYGRKDLSLGVLVNMTDGGEGILNVSLSTKIVIGEKAKIRHKLKGHPRFGVKHTPETIFLMKRKDLKYLKKYKTSLPGGKNGNAKVVLNLKTGIFYDCCKEAANTTNIKYPYFAAMLNGQKVNKTNFIYC